jgi:type II secretory ATPase GspE/PulE/Tfp pilus assembly ATPase PilB-like protein
MATVLSPRNQNSLNELKSLHLSTLSEDRLRRVQRVHEDLDHQFLEKQTQLDAQEVGMPYIDLVGFPINSSLLGDMNADEVLKYNLGIFAKKHKELYIVTIGLDPNQTNPLFERFKLNGYAYKLFHCSQDSIKKLHTTYLNVDEEKGSSGEVNITSNTEETELDYNLQHIQALIENATVSDIIDIMLTAALKNDASDIHLEPEKDVYNMRLRVDGVLNTFAHLPKRLQATIESRIKILAGLKINIDNIPQDGRISFKYDEKEIDVRVSMLPSNYGYSIVMRLLGTGSVNLVLEDLGFSGLAKSRIEEAIQKPQGMILNTGPTGSGKTTTLYAFINQLNDNSTKIITLEDPIEYKLEGISQTQIDKNAGYTFSAGLRSILRQDPNVVMVGEIRDNETAEIATQAALTGHLMLSTLHTNDAAGAITRFLELGVRGYAISDSLSAVIGQRLLRRLCNNCKQIIPSLTDPIEQRVFDEQIAALPKSANVVLPDQFTFYTAKGCDQCHGTGYKGRIGAYEVLNVNDGLRNLLASEHISVQEVRQVAAEGGMLTMLQDGILKVLDGMTDMTEVLRNITH